jgi:8-oxo-dGTP pyrophosphatase MutT (NUDIX family)
MPSIYEPSKPTGCDATLSVNRVARLGTSAAGMEAIVGHSPRHSNYPILLRDWVDRGPSRVHPDAAPDCLTPMIAALRLATPQQLSTNDPPADGIGGRQAAVLVLLSGSADTGPAVVLVRRGRQLRDHGGEVGFPGGGWEPRDASPIETALREAAEEIGLEPTEIDSLAVLPRLLIRASGFEVTAVIGYWRELSPIGPVDRAETEEVFRVVLRDIAPADRWSTLTIPDLDWSGPSVLLTDSTLVWGYTAELLAFMCRHV